MKSKQKRNNSVKRPKTNKKLKIFGLLVVALIIVVFLLELTNTTHWFHKSTSTIKAVNPSTTQSLKTSSSSAKNSSQKESTNNTTTPSSNSSATNSTSTNKSISSSSAGTSTPSSSVSAPVAPSGSFVSDHSPNLSNSPHPSTEQSVCLTDPGATCYIEFTQGNLVKKLPAETTDSDGQAIWTWSLSQDGFTTGSWTITAIASNSSGTSSSNDSKSLVVQQ